jgi:hypothetical protein
MLERIAADAVLLLHVAFVLFVVLGGALLLRWPKLAWIHLPAVVWAALVELNGWICPLTPLEVEFRRASGEAGYAGDFLEHYIVVLLYPEGLTRSIQIGLAIVLVAINVAFYAAALRSRRHRGSA